MKMITLIYAGLLAIALAQTIHYYPLMPEIMASRYDFGGSPVQWSGKGLFFAIYLGIMILVSLSIILNAIMMGRCPERMMNIANKDFWLAPERKDNTIKDMQNRVAQFGAAGLLFTVGIIQCVILQNLDAVSQEQLNIILMTIIAAFVVYTVTWAIFLIARYRKPKHL